MSESPRGSHHSIEQNAGSSSTTTGIPRSQSTIQKSMIPKYRSLSQPSSAMLLDEGKLNEAKAENLIAEKLLEDNSGLVDEFKDCLDSVKLDLDLDSNSTTALDDIKISSETTEDILYILPLEKEGSREEIKKVQSSLPSTPTSTSKYARKVVPRKNSSSGIPVSLSIPKSTPKSIPISKSSITKPRNVPAVSPSAKKQPPPPTNTSAHTTNEPASKRNVSPMNSSKRIHELFATKKKRYETLRKEVVDKQKPVLEMYTSLQKLKKKLEESGQNVVLEPMRILDFDGMPKEVKSSTGTTPSRPETADNSFEGGAGEQLGKLNVTQEAVTQIKKTISGIQTTTCQICKELIEGRQELLRQLRRLCDSDKCKEEIGHELEMRKIEGENLENSLKVALKEQEKEVEDLIAGWSQIAESGDQEKVDEYKTKIASLEQKLKEVTSELNNAQEKVVNDSAPETEELRADNGKLKQRISTLEKQLETERKKTQSEAEKYKTAENALKSYKSKLKDVDTTKQQHDSKISQLTQELRSAQTKIKVMERNYEKEIAELNKSRNLDKTVIERLNKDKSTFETRIRVANQQIETLREENLVRECKLREDAVNAKKDLEIQENYVGQLKTEIEKLKHELLEVQTYAKQTSEVLRKKSDMKGAVGPITEKECELQIEVVAQRAAIKSLQEKIDANTKEKLRFIETIERMNGQPDQINQDIVKTLVMREEDITHLHQILKKREDEITTWKLESQTLQAKLDHLTAQIEAMQTENGSHDLKNMLREGKTKLEQALMKSLENEHKLIKYEHELTQKSQAVSNMENMLKVRDGIVSVLKAKKVELEMENKSLAKYSEEIRNYVLETKEELKEKNDIIKQLQSALETKTREWQKFERQVEELEDKLASTNEKRYKLQDTVSLMERELQATKADVQTRYDDDMKAPGRIPCITAIEASPYDDFDVDANADAVADEYVGVDQSEDVMGDNILTADRVDNVESLSPWAVASVTLYNHYKSAYERDCYKESQSQSFSSLQSYSCAERGPIYTHPPTHRFPIAVNGHIGDHFDVNRGDRRRNDYSSSSNSNCSTLSCKKKASYRKFTVEYPDGDQQQHDDADLGFVPRPVYEPFSAMPQNRVYGAGKEYRPILFGGIDKYRVSNSGRLLWCDPSSQMKLNSCLIANDLIAQSRTHLVRFPNRRSTPPDHLPSDMQNYPNFMQNL